MIQNNSFNNQIIFQFQALGSLQLSINLKAFGNAQINQQKSTLQIAPFRMSLPPQSIILFQSPSYYQLNTFLKSQIMPRLKKKQVQSPLRTNPIIQLMNQKQNLNIPKQQLIKAQEFQTSSAYQKSIVSESSAFWPFNNSLDNNNFLAHINNVQACVVTDSHQRTTAFVNDSTEKVFKMLKRHSKNDHFQIGQIVLAKCVNEPLWPCRITFIQNIPGLVPEQIVYHIKFIYDNNTSLVNIHSLIKFTSKNVEQLRKVTQNKKLLKSIKMTEKLINKNERQNNQNSKQKQKERHSCTNQYSVVQQTTSSSQSSGESFHQDVKVSNEGFYSLRSKEQPQHIQKQQTQGDISQEINLKISMFKPIVLIKGKNLQINLQGMQHLNFQHSQSNEQVKKPKQKQKQRRIRLKTQRVKSDLSKPLRPINLVLETPKLNPNCFLNKIILKFSQLDQPEQDSCKNDTQLRNPQNDQTIMQENIITIVKKIKPQTTKIQPKKIAIKSKDDMLHMLQIQKYLVSYLDDIQRIRQIGFKEFKQRQILQFLSKQVNLFLLKENYSIYSKILKMCIQIIQKSEIQHMNELFCLNLKHKLKSINEFLQDYQGDNKYVKRLVQINGKKLNEFVQKQQRKSQHLKNQKQLLLSIEDTSGEQEKGLQNAKKPTKKNAKGKQKIKI